MIRYRVHWKKKLGTAHHNFCLVKSATRLLCLYLLFFTNNGSFTFFLSFCIYFFVYWFIDLSWFPLFFSFSARPSSRYLHENEFIRVMLNGLSGFWKNLNHPVYQEGMSVSSPQAVNVVFSILSYPWYLCLTRWVSVSKEANMNTFCDFIVVAVDHNRRCLFLISSVTQQYQSCVHPEDGLRIFE